MTPIKRIVLRFLRGFAAGAIASTVVLLPLSAGSFKELGTVVLPTLALAAIMGGISGGILALDKAIRG